MTSSARSGSSEPRPNSEALPRLTDIDAELARRHLLDFVPYQSKRYESPLHLSPLTDCIEAAVRGEPQFVVCHAPPRHAKTETVLHTPAWALQQNPELVFSYSTYADRLSRSKARKARMLAEASGLVLPLRNLNEWRNAEGGGMLAGGVGGPLTGHGVNIAFVDDPVKNRIEAESGTYRERLWDWFNDVLLTRIEPGGSVFVFMTRWHPDDLSGRLIKDGWRYICLPAIDAEGKPLWGKRWTAEELAKKRRRVGEYTWASLYQGQPRPRGGTLFGDPSTFTDRPTNYRAAFGVDLSYSAKTSSDYSAVVKMMKSGGKVYVVHAMRKQVRAPKFKRLCRALHRAEKAAPWLWYTSTTEQGVAHLFQEGPRSVPLEPRLAKGDKFTRAQMYAAAWNRGDVLLPKNAPWLDEFLSEHATFTGHDGDTDDMVDAAVAAFDSLDEPIEDIDPTPRGSKALEHAI